MKVGDKVYYRNSSGYAGFDGEYFVKAIDQEGNLQLENGHNDLYVGEANVFPADVVPLSNPDKDETARILLLWDSVKNYQINDEMEGWDD